MGNLPIVYLNNKNIMTFILDEKRVMFMNDASICMLKDNGVKEENFHKYIENICNIKIYDISSKVSSRFNLNNKEYIFYADVINSVSSDKAFMLNILESPAIEARELEYFIASNPDLFISTITTFFDNKYELVVIIDSNCNIVYMNPYHEEILGLKKGESLNKNIKEVIPGTRLDICLNMGKADVGWTQSIKGKKKLVARIPIKNRKGKIVGAMGKILFKNSSIVEDLLAQVDIEKRKNDLYKAGLMSRYDINDLIGNSKLMLDVKKQIEIAWDNDFPVFITGESGVGKEIVAQAIHGGSNRKNFPFVCLNCAAINSSLVESELFGYEGGAFTGAIKTGNKGKFELASGGVLFFDEIGDMPLDIQAKLLRIIAEKEFFRVGGNKQVKSDVRLISATNRDISDLIKRDKFRQDLLYRIKVIEIDVPPLRERKEDIPMLILHYISKVCYDLSLKNKYASKEYIETICRYNWPGNVRELRNAVERSIVSAAKSENLFREDIPVYILDVDSNILNYQTPYEPYRKCFPIKELKNITEKKYIINMLKENEWNISKTSRSLGISRVWLYKKIKNLGISKMIQ